MSAKGFRDVCCKHKTDSVEFRLHVPDVSHRVVETAPLDEGSSQVYIIFCCPVFSQQLASAWCVFALHTHVCMYVLFGAAGAGSSVTFD